MFGDTLLHYHRRSLFTAYVFLTKQMYTILHLLYPQSFWILLDNIEKIFVPVFSVLYYL